MYKTEQEKFWSNEFGTEYIERNKGEQLLASNLNFFSKALQQAGRIDSCIEFGANIGMNLKALKFLYPSIRLSAIEINENASTILGDFIGKDNVYNISIFDHKVESKVQLSLIKGVLIHINPNMLQKVYEQLYNSSEKFILIAEYYNPTPVALNYRGHEDRLFKRDFAGEFLDKYLDTELIDYGFSYRRDPAFPQDDITWFLIRKK
jgi:pseudaminic acid biosynthesis-associated methylase